MHIDKIISEKDASMSKAVDDRLFVTALITFKASPLLTINYILVLISSKIGERLFRVPKTGFESSFLYNHICSSKTSSQGPLASDEDGLSRDEPLRVGSGRLNIGEQLIELKNVGADEFRSFLEVLIPV